MEMARRQVVRAARLRAMGAVAMHQYTEPQAKYRLRYWIVPYWQRQTMLLAGRKRMLSVTRQPHLAVWRAVAEEVLVAMAGGVVMIRQIRQMVLLK